MKWEYLTVQMDGHIFKPLTVKSVSRGDYKHLLGLVEAKVHPALGDEGWELVSSSDNLLTMFGTGLGWNVTLRFKRQKQDGTTE